MDKELPTWAILGMGAAILGGIYVAIRASQAKARAAVQPVPEYNFTVGPITIEKSDAGDSRTEQHVVEQLALAERAANAGACMAANDALLHAISEMNLLDKSTLLRVDARLRETLIQRYSDPKGLCL